MLLHQQPALHRPGSARAIMLALFVVIIAVIAILFWPPPASLSTASPDPVATFDEARERIRAMWEKEGVEVIPECRTQALLQGRKTARVIVFLHGYTSCPAQFLKLAQSFVADGANVLIAAVPFHGLPDRMTPRHSELTAQDLAAYADDVVDVARGLGDSVTVMGLSMGGTIAAWIAENRSDVDLAVVISPVFGYAMVPTPLTLAAANLFRRLPDKFEWWDTTEREQAPPSYAYPRYSRRALAQLLLFSSAVLRDSHSGVPGVRRILVVTNANDSLVNNHLTLRLAENWHRSGRARVGTYEFPEHERLGHDLIDPNIPRQRTDFVYSRLRELMRQE
jgi:carboxylesterase